MQLKAKTSNQAILTLGIVTGAFGVLWLSTLLNTVVDSNPRILAAEYNITNSQILAPPRGLFYSADGVPLVRNELRYSVELAGADLKVIQADPKRWQQLLLLLKAEPPTPLTDGDKVTLASAVQANSVVQLTEQFGDINFQIKERPVRNYLFPQQYAQIIGYTGVASPQDVEQGLSPTDTVGKYRLEQGLDTQLRGVPGKQQTIAGTTTRIPAIPGSSVQLTLDHRWQQALYTAVASQAKAVNAYAGAAVVMHANTGAIKAYTSYPSFDANLFTLGGTMQQFKDLQQDTKTPLVDKVIGLQAPPGSTFKVISAYTALQEKVITPASVFVSRGCMQLGNAEFCEFGKRALGSLNVVGALTRSSNTFFCTALTRAASTPQGLSRWVEIMQQFGIGNKTGIDLAGEVSGVLPSPDYKRKIFNDRWYGGDTCNTAIGQGFVSVTPMQMALVAAIYANNGSVVTPYVVDKVVSQEGHTIQQTEVRIVRKIPLDKDIAGAIEAGMYGVAHNGGGSAYQYLRDAPGGFHVKTGSADAVSVINGKRKQGVHGWIIGWFTYEGERYAFAVHLHFGGGSWNAGPVIRGFANCLFSDFPATCRS